MQIEFVTHSSVVYRRDPINLICDPWLVGTAFDDGWALLSPPVLGPEDFAGITHIWFSHEHPDHFSPRSLSAIPQDIRQRITVMYHRSADRKIFEFCRGLGFGNLLELDEGAWYTLAPGFDVRCDTWQGTDDSWLLTRTPEGITLNLNDCQVTSEQQARALRAITGPVDVLLTQFSISSWDGDADDLERRRAGAQYMVDRAVMQAQVFEARYVIPFASFIWCCHEENAYMNAAMVSVGEVAEALRSRAGTGPVVMYPGDRWEVGTAYDSSAAIGRYAADVAGLQERVMYRTPSVPFDELQALAERFRARLNAGVSPLRRRLRAVKLNALHQLRRHPQEPLRGRLLALIQIALLRPRPARIWFTDYQSSATFDLLVGLRNARFAREHCDIELSSSALAYALKFLWGGESLQVNGRFREIYRDGRYPLFDYLWIASAMNHSDGAKARPL